MNFISVSRCIYTFRRELQRPGKYSSVAIMFGEHPLRVMEERSLTTSRYANIFAIMLTASVVSGRVNISRAILNGLSSNLTSNNRKFCFFSSLPPCLEFEFYLAISLTARTNCPMIPHRCARSASGPRMKRLSKVFYYQFFELNTSDVSCKISVLCLAGRNVVCLHSRNGNELFENYTLWLCIRRGAKVITFIVITERLSFGEIVSRCASNQF